MFYQGQRSRCCGGWLFEVLACIYIHVNCNPRTWFEIFGKQVDQYEDAMLEYIQRLGIIEGDRNSEVSAITWFSIWTDYEFRLVTSYSQSSEFRGKQIEKFTQTFCTADVSWSSQVTQFFFLGPLPLKTPWNFTIPPQPAQYPVSRPTSRKKKKIITPDSKLHRKVKFLCNQ